MSDERNETLLARAERVLGAPSSIENLDWWSSNTEALALRPCSDPKFFQLTSIDIRTGQQMPLDAFNNAFSKEILGTPMIVTTVGEPGSEIVYNPPPCDLSPDGKWFLWLSANQTWVAASLDAAQRREWDEVAVTRQDPFLSQQCVWLSDDRWAELVSQYRNDDYMVTDAVIHGFDDESERDLAELHVEEGLIVGVTRSGQILYRHPSEDHNVSEEILILLDVEAEPPTVRRTHIKLPGHWKVCDAHVSRVSDQVALMLETGDRFPKEYSLWVSDLEGKGMRELGYMRGRTVSTSTNGRGRAYFWPDSVRWLPDGRRLSFVFMNELYVLEAF